MEVYVCTNKHQLALRSLVCRNVYIYVCMYVSKVDSSLTCRTLLLEYVEDN